MKNITRRKIIEAGFVSATALALGLALGSECWHGVPNKSLEQRVETSGKAEKEEMGNKKVVLNSQSAITNFGFSGNSVYYTVSKSDGSRFAYEDGKVFSAPIDSETIHYAEPEKNNSRVVRDLGEPIQFMLPSSPGFYAVAGGKQYVQTDKGLVEKTIGNGSDAVHIEVPYDYHGGMYCFRNENPSEEVKKRDSLRSELNRKLGYTGINYPNQIGLNADGEVQVVYRKQVGSTPQNTKYNLIVETLDRGKVGAELYDNLVGAYGEKENN